MRQELRVLIVEDSEDDVMLIVRELQKKGFDPDYLHVCTRDGMRDALKERGWDVVIADYRMPGFSGPEALQVLKDADIDIPFILVSGRVGEETAVKMMHDGASDYVLKQNLSRLGPAVERELEDAAVRRDRQNTLDMLRMSEERFRRIAETSIDVIYEVNSQGIVTYASPALYDLGGYRPDEMVGTNFGSYLLESDLPLAMEAFADVFSGKSISMLKLAFVHKDGRVLYTETNAVPVFDNGSVVGSYGIIRDVTERENALRKLQESEERFRNITETSIDFIYQLDMEGRVLYASPAVENVIGYVSEEVLGRRFHEYFSPEALPEAVKGFQKVLQGKYLRLLALQMTRKDGEPAEIETNAVPIVDGTSIVGAQGIARDITERRIAAKRLEESHKKLEESLSGTINSLATAVEMRDPYTAGHQAHVAQLATAIAHEMGLDEERTRGLNMASIIHDVGKINVPAEILSKTGSLSDTEFGLIKIHPEAGYNIVKDIEFLWPVAEIVYQHHERLDGSGYPRGLAGDAILQEAQILAVADTIEAMVFHRPYRPALGIETALEEISRNSGIIYDPAVVDACITLFTKKEFTFQ